MNSGENSSAFGSSLVATRTLQSQKRSGHSDNHHRQICPHCDKSLCSKTLKKRCVYCTGTGIELQLPEVPATVLQRVKDSYRYRYHCTVSYSTGDHFELVVATGERSNQHLENFASLDLFLLRCIISWNLWGTWLRDTCKHSFRTLAQKRCSLGAVVWRSTTLYLTARMYYIIRTRERGSGDTAIPNLFWWNAAVVRCHTLFCPPAKR